MSKPSSTFFGAKNPHIPSNFRLASLARSTGYPSSLQAPPSLSIRTSTTSASRPLLRLRSSRRHAVCGQASTLAGDGKSPVLVVAFALQTTYNNTIANRETIYDTRVHAWNKYVSGGAMWTSKGYYGNQSVDGRVSWRTTGTLSSWYLKVLLLAVLLTPVIARLVHVVRTLIKQWSTRHSSTLDNLTRPLRCQLDFGNGETGGVLFWHIFGRRTGRRRNYKS